MSLTRFLLSKRWKSIKTLQSKDGVCNEFLRAILANLWMQSEQKDEVYNSHYQMDIIDSGPIGIKTNIMPVIRPAEYTEQLFLSFRGWKFGILKLNPFSPVSDIRSGS